ncbi:polygalacturonase-like [Vicia villosa]|uniref:polygalacturonase-like n=1 Tax=Vicia villosa TaxID=3911 RepID=UPI00273AE80B|nr:polygalacturonase-like [Vicia villosa]
MMKNFKISIIISFLYFLADLVAAQSGVFDITKFGGAPDADITKAFTTAWNEACASTTAAKIVIPVGTYKMGLLEVKGPCKAPVEVQVDGTIQAPPNNADLKGAEQWIRFDGIDSLTVSGKGVFDGQGATAWKDASIAWKDKDHGKGSKLRAINVYFANCKNCLVTGVTSKDSKYFHFMVLGCTNIKFDAVKIIAPDESPNTDGIHLGRSNGVTIINTDIGTGDDCVSLGDGSKNVTVENVKCGPGHGISVGSLGKYPNEEDVAGFIVKNCTLTKTENGVRIKTWPDTPGKITVSDMHFEDITMNDVMNPVIVDQEYCPWNQCSKKNPSQIKLSKVTFKNIKGTSGTSEGVIIICSSGVPCDGVELNNVDLTFNGAPAVAKCSHVKPVVTGKAPVCGGSASASPSASPTSPSASPSASPASTSASPSASPTSDSTSPSASPASASASPSTSPASSSASPSTSPASAPA